MSAIAKRRQKRRVSIMDLTPLIDVMFILMIFILVTAQYTSINSIKVDLPKAETAQRVGEKQVVVISLDKNEVIYYEGENIELLELELKLKELVKLEKAPQVIIQADEKSRTGDLVQVMDIVQKVGLRKISIQTDK